MQAFSNRDECRAYWRERVLEWRESGLKQPDFCQREGLNLWTFKDHSRKYHREQKTNVVLIEVPRIQAPQIPKPSAVIKINVRECTLELTTGVDLPLLADVLDLMERR